MAQPVEIIFEFNEHSLLMGRCFIHQHSVTSDELHKFLFMPELVLSFLIRKLASPGNGWIDDDTTGVIHGKAIGK